MITIKKYIKAASLEEAYELNQKRSNLILGGMLWIKMSRRSVHTAIDLSDLDMDKIEEDDEAFTIWAMCSLRDMETNPGLHEAFGGAIRESLRNIVGVQFRNSATIGGSLYGRFGFSDILTCLLALDCEVELYRQGRMPLRKYIDLPHDNDIVTAIVIKKDRRKVIYQSFRMTKTDIPILNSAVSLLDGQITAAIGARPMRASVIDLPGLKHGGERQEFAVKAADRFTFGSNMRGSAAYRQHLAAVGIDRALKELYGGAV